MCAIPERVQGQRPEQAGLRVRAVVVALVAATARSQASFVRDHRIVPRRQADAEVGRDVVAQAGAENRVRGGRRARGYVIDTR